MRREEATNSAASIRQADITKAIKAAQAAGLTVFEFHTTRHGVRVVTTPGAPTSGPANPWDEVLANGKA